MKFFVLNDQPERREGLKALLRQIDRRANFSEAKDWRQASHRLKRDLHDLFVIDWQLRWMRVADLLCLLREHPALPVAILTDDTTRATVNALLHVGVLGIIPRSLNPHLILRIFELVLLGGHYVPVCALNPTLSSAFRVPASCSELPAAPKPLPRNTPVKLSPRQHQIMRLLIMGNTNKVIARALNISEGTVKIHLTSIFKMLGATNRAAAVAIYNGWQFQTLEVLHNTAQTIEPNAIHDLCSPIPLRQSKLAQAPAATSENGPALLIAAQTTAPYNALETQSVSPQNAPTPAHDNE
ncbi:response regulator transcription factor [Mycoavidus sp. SF9855]|uniref:response regulator transcription factor n=1 Tax=Mycoavidus sp. SF9855 TaxID=2968475 RepID=UPI00211CB4A2|nr:response regulator transcription factor [Mycoavidus sp. SF9855]UUM21227.1 response regulator transcription factor [Mycoavidus sp. SF9855]